MPLAIVSVFVLLAVVHVTLLVGGRHPWDTITKVLLAPLLALGVALAGGPWLLVAALMLYAIGDAFMDFERTLLLGMLSFAAGHLALIALLWNDGIRPAWWIVAVLYLASAANVGVLWRGLPARLRAPVVAYSLVLATMAAFVLSSSVTAGIGALVFMASDSLIAARLASRIRDSKPATLAVMITYAGAIALISIGLLA